MPVVAAGKFDDDFPLGGGARDPDGRHDRFGAGTHQAHAPHGREGFLDSCPSSSSSSVGAPKESPLRAVRATAEVTTVGAWPKMEAPQELQKSI